MMRGGWKERTRVVTDVTAVELKHRTSRDVWSVFGTFDHAENPPFLCKYKYDY